MHSRRDFVLRLGGLGLAGLTLGAAGCDAASDRLARLIAPEGQDPARPPASDSIDEVAHLLNRLTWGARPGDRARVEEMGTDAFIAEQLDPAALDDRLCQWKVQEIETLQLPRGELYEVPPARLALDLARARLLRALRSRRQLQEVMVEAWTDHFNIGISKGECKWMKIADDHETIRPHCMGNFRALVRASLTSPAMLISLDGLDNRVMHPDERPNENHARELLELHTMGVDGGYTQRDVMETARCLSGWTFTHNWRQFFTARVKFEPSRHDNGAKSILGTAIPAGGGEDDVERLLDIVCAHPSTARHVARRLCRTFVADDPSESCVGAVAESLSKTGGEMVPALATLFGTADFAAARGTLLKRPTHFVISALRALDAQSDCGPEMIAHLERMGHAPFQCATPKGYPTEAAPWLGTLLWRWTLAMHMVEGRLPGTQVDIGALRSRFGNAPAGVNADADPATLDALLAHIVGRTPTPEEREAFGADSSAVALALASPAFQWH